MELVKYPGKIIKTFILMTNLNQPGVKDDANKLRYDLIPTSAITGLAEVLTMGAKKYTPNGWRNVPDGIERYYAALYRHLLAWRNGEQIDPESGLHHLKHVMINVAFLLELSSDEKNNSKTNKSSIDCSNFDCSYKNLIKLYNEGERTKQSFPYL